MAQTGVFMNNTAETTEITQEKSGRGMLDSAVECCLHSAGASSGAPGVSGGWVVYPFTTFSLLLGGRSRIAFGKNPADAIDREAGAVTCIPAGVWRKADYLAPQGASFLWARVSFTFFGGPDLLGFFSVPRIFPPDKAEPFRRIIAGFASPEESRGQTLRKIIRVRKTLYGLLDLTLDLSEPKPELERAMAAAGRLASAAGYIGSHFRGPVDVGAAARLARLSKSRFHRVFREAFGIPPAEWQIRLRMREAQKLLLFTDLSMAEISEKTGHADQFHFSRTFKKRFGVSPLQFRKNSASAAGLGL
jgi:AraC-like DNA-binding protein